VATAGRHHPSFSLARSKTMGKGNNSQKNDKKNKKAKKESKKQGASNK
jgi:hypothetical protein